MTTNDKVVSAATGGDLVRVTTSRCLSAGAEATRTLCPYTGSDLAGGRVRTGPGVGVFSLCALDDNGTYLAYGGGGNNKEDAMALLVCDDGSTVWKCRLPEPMEAGLVVGSGGLVVGGGRSGRAYVWSGYDGGDLLRSWQAHYRPVTTLAFSSCGGTLLTGGADGVVHSWSVQDLLDNGQNNNHGQNNDDVNPVHTWSEHQLSVTALHALPSNRAVSVSTDRHLIVMELCNGTTLARILLPSSLSCVTADKNAHRLYTGAGDGAIYCIDLDIYAISCTAESATIVSEQRNRRPKVSTSGSLLLDTILHDAKSNNNNNNDHVSEFRGHERRVTALSVLESSNNGDNDNNDVLLVSGGEDGTVRVWDVRSRCCTNIVRPWTTTTTDDATVVCPVSSVVVVPGATGRRIDRSSSKATAASCLAPLQRYPHRGRASDDLLFRNKNADDDFDDAVSAVVPGSSQSDASLRFWDDGPRRNDDDHARRAKRHRTNTSPLSGGAVAEEERRPRVVVADVLSDAAREEIAALRKELEEANTTIDRWQKVNGVLASKLKKARGGKKK